MIRYTWAACLAGLWLCARASSGLAQDDKDITEYVPEGDIEEAGEDHNQGWNGKLSLSANLNLASNDKVVGQVDGFSLLIGTGIDGTLQYDAHPHRWVNNLTINEIWAKTPVLDEFVKSNDLVTLESIYNYFVWDWGGIFARVAAETALFTAERITADPQTYAEVGDDPTTDGELLERFQLSDPFQPFTLNESAGLFAEPLSEPAATVSLRAGFGGRHTFADGVRVVDSEDGTFDDDGDMATAELPLVTYTVLDDVHQAGLELFAGLDGAGADGRLTYGVGVSALFPFINNDDTGRDTLDLTKVALQGGVGTSVFTWMTLNYELKIISDPQLIDEVQVQNSLLLTIAVTPIDTFAPPPDEASEKLAEAEKRAEEAEARAAEAEQRASDAEAKLEGQDAAAPAQPEEAPAPAPAQPAAPAPAEPAEPAPTQPAEPAEPATAQPGAAP